MLISIAMYLFALFQSRAWRDNLLLYDHSSNCKHPNQLLSIHISETSGRRCGRQDYILTLQEFLKSGLNQSEMPWSSGIEIIFRQ